MSLIQQLSAWQLNIKIKVWVRLWVPMCVIAPRPDPDEGYSEPDRRAKCWATYTHILSDAINQQQIEEVNCQMLFWSQVFTDTRMIISGSSDIKYSGTWKRGAYWAAWLVYKEVPQRQPWKSVAMSLIDSKNRTRIVKHTRSKLIIKFQGKLLRLE